MKLLTQSDDCWRFQLSLYEADLLRGLLKNFPFTSVGPAEVSKCDTLAGNSEREKLLGESLAEHRTDLQKLAQELLSEDQWRPSPAGTVLTLTSQSREILLQILNDIRLGCWHALGEPDDVEQFVSSEPPPYQRVVMDLAGYFEINLLDPKIMI